MRIFIQKVLIFIKLSKPFLAMMKADVASGKQPPAANNVMPKNKEKAIETNIYIRSAHLN
jgi:hypothetical protein